MTRFGLAAWAGCARRAASVIVRTAPTRRRTRTGTTAARCIRPLPRKVAGTDGLRKVAPFSAGFDRLRPRIQFATDAALPPHDVRLPDERARLGTDQRDARGARP